MQSLPLPPRHVQTNRAPQATCGYCTTEPTSGGAAPPGAGRAPCSDDLSLCPFLAQQKLLCPTGGGNGSSGGSGGGGGGGGNSTGGGIQHGGWMATQCRASCKLCRPTQQGAGVALGHECSRG
jgi:hypothetical protein